MKLAGLHLEINPRGGEMSIYEKEWGGEALCTCKHMSETASGAFSGTLHSIENFSFESNCS